MSKTEENCNEIQPATETDSFLSEIPHEDNVDVWVKRSSLFKKEANDNVQSGQCGDVDAEESGKKNDKKETTISYFKLFRFANWIDGILIFVGLVSGFCAGFAVPIMFILFGDLTTEFIDFGVYKSCYFVYEACLLRGLVNVTKTEWNETVIAAVESFESNSVDTCMKFVYVAFAVMIFAAIYVACWTLVSTRQTSKIRLKYFNSVLRQDIAFHDQISSGELTNRLTININKIKEGLGSHVGVTLQFTGVMVGCIIVAFIRTWKITLVNFAAVPFLGIVASIIFKINTMFTEKELTAYAKAGSIAEEAFLAIRTVVAFGCQDKVVERYGSNLQDAKLIGMKKGTLLGLSVGLNRFLVFAMYAISFWYGSVLVVDGEIKAGDFITAFFSVIFVAFSLGAIMKNLEYFTAATAAGAQVFEIMDRKSQIDVLSPEGLKPADADASIILKGVSFSYPARSEVEVLKNVTFCVPSGQTVAVVGQSGCGKSTIVQLLQRFYDPELGSVSIGGHNVRSLNVRWLREQIGVVAQEPVLFNTTIEENIRWGREGVTDDEVYEAAKLANAYDFILSLPDKFSTHVGDRGSKMSGGQKQRIAIARAIVRNPHILLLDEATSALDTESEKLVQLALEKASAGRTTIVIAHRLSTIRGADKIIALQRGEVKEQGSHNELMEIKDGIYRNLVDAQIVEDKRCEVELNKQSDDAISQEQDKYRSPTRSPNKHKKSPKKSKSPLARLLQRRNRSSEDEGIGEETDHLDIHDADDSFSNQGKSDVNYNDDIKDEEEEDLPEAPWKRLWLLNKPEWGYMAVGCIFAVMAGSGDPLLALIFGEVLTVYTNNKDQLHWARIYSLAMFFLGVITFFTFWIKSILLTKAGMALTERLRKETFRAVLRQDIAYFDNEKNSSGALCVRLATDAAKVEGCTGQRIGVLCQNFGAMGCGIAIAFAFSWEMAFLMLGLVPFIALGGMIDMLIMTGQRQFKKTEYEFAAQLASQSINNIRLVASLTKESEVYRLYEKSLEKPTKTAIRKDLLTSLSYGYSQSVAHFVMAAVFRLGIHLVAQEELQFERVFSVILAVLFGALAIGQNSAFVPDYAESKLSAARIIALLDSKPQIDIYSDDGYKPAHCKGNVAMKSIYFRYPTRPDQPILREFDLKVKSGQTLALVGKSGCGKSTTVQLIERFYDITDGQLLIDNVNVKEINVNWLRQQIGIVSQEPVLFDQSIKENILFGDCTRQPTDDEVRGAAEFANAHSFIESLPQKYDTRVGGQGSQLSGGQKQRIAIARALLRNPKILLLDEATSALDTESEKIVQEALDAAREGRTCVVIAHRLSTVKNADQIAVIEDGRVIEVGTHDELLSRGAAYYNLVNAQLTLSD